MGKGPRVDYVTRASPKECLDRAESFALGQGGSIKERTESSVTFERRIPMSSGEVWLVAIASIFTLGVALLYVVFRFWFKEWARLHTRPTENGHTRLLVDGNTGGYREELRLWVENELADRTA
jgi:hypothetical protein